MLPMHVVEPFCTDQPAEETRLDGACMLQGLATVAALHHDTASSGGRQNSGVENNDSCPNPLRRSKEEDSDRDSNTQWYESLSPILGCLVQADENSEPHTEQSVQGSVQGSGQEGRGEDGAHACEAVRVKDAQQRCQADGVGDGARLHHGLVMNGREHGEESVQSNPEGGVEGRPSPAGHTRSCSFPCAHVTDGHGAHGGVRCDAMGTGHDNA